MFGIGYKGPIEEQMAEWLAHPMEFGVRPKSVRFKRTYKCKLITYGEVQIHLVKYEMPDQTVGRGFVNGGLTWSFLGPEVNAIKDDDLLTAYCGWAWLFPALQAGSVMTTFQPTTEAAFMEKKNSIADLRITDRYNIAGSELFEFMGTRSGRSIRGAGDLGADVEFDEGDPRYALPSIYLFLGPQVIQTRD